MAGTELLSSDDEDDGDEDEVKEEKATPKKKRGKIKPETEKVKTSGNKQTEDGRSPEVMEDSVYLLYIMWLCVSLCIAFMTKYVY